MSAGVRTASPKHLYDSGTITFEVRGFPMNNKEVTLLGENIFLALSAVGKFKFGQISFDFDGVQGPYTEAQLFWMKYLRCSTLEIKGDVGTEVVKNPPPKIPSCIFELFRRPSKLKGFSWPWRTFDPTDDSVITVVERVACRQQHCIHRSAEVREPPVCSILACRQDMARALKEQDRESFRVHLREYVQVLFLSLQGPFMNESTALERKA